MKSTEGSQCVTIKRYLHGLEKASTEYKVQPCPNQLENHIRPVVPEQATGGSLRQVHNSIEGHHFDHASQGVFIQLFKARKLHQAKAATFNRQKRSQPSSLPLSIAGSAEGGRERPRGADKDKPNRREIFEVRTYHDTKDGFHQKGNITTFPSSEKVYKYTEEEMKIGSSNPSSPSDSSKK
ncbi:hypothetical protein BGZ65_003113 [Modicella reniformis]|uniref:Uncharacterized protein n=1 Tax=Modicella reniformis TaxID=1440133 RepID=A0A9P6STM5_9FUNG|nr:hypothetical protein BGZ65_003113 [Modicella reniformis]